MQVRSSREGGQQQGGQEKEEGFKRRRVGRGSREGEQQQGGQEKDEGLPLPLSTSVDEYVLSTKTPITTA